MPTTSTDSANQPPIRAVPMEVFPTAGSLKEVVETGFAILPITDPNALYALLMTYHNTLLKEVNRS